MSTLIILPGREVLRKIVPKVPYNILRFVRKPQPNKGSWLQYDIAIISRELYVNASRNKKLLHTRFSLPEDSLSQETAFKVRYC